jgi:hypothetical protein
VTTRSTYGGSAKAEPPRWSGESRAGLETQASWRPVRRPGRRRAPLRRRLTAPPTSVRRVRCSPAFDVVTPMSATTPAAETTRAPVAATRIALVRLTSPISSCLEHHQDTHQEAHQKAVSAGHSVALPSAPKRRATASRPFSPRRVSSSLAIPERAGRQFGAFRRGQPRLRWLAWPYCSHHVALGAPAP